MQQLSACTDLVYLGVVQHEHTVTLHLVYVRAYMICDYVGCVSMCMQRAYSCLRTSSQ